MIPLSSGRQITEHIWKNPLFGENILYNFFDPCIASLFCVRGKKGNIEKMKS